MYQSTILGTSAPPSVSCTMGSTLAVTNTAPTPVVTPQPM